MRYTCIVVDDNVIERDLISLFVSKIPALDLVAICEDGVEASSILTSRQVDIVFCDIDMPELSGTALLKSLKTPPAFVFITSFADYAVESYNLDVIDFVLKPVTFERLLKASNKAIEYVTLKARHADQPLTVENTIVKDDDCFFIKETNGITKLKYADVTFIESIGDFSKVHTIQSRTHLVLSSLKSIETQLPGEIFKRVQKQYIVNLQFVSTVTTTEILLSNSQQIPISALYRQALLDAFVSKDLIKRK